MIFSRYLSYMIEPYTNPLKKNSTFSDFAQIFTLGAESCADHVARLLSQYVLLEGGQIRIFPEFMQKKLKK